MKKIISFASDFGLEDGSVGIVKTWNGSTALVLNYITGAFNHVLLTKDGERAS